MWGSHDWLLLEDMETRSRERWTAAESDKEDEVIEMEENVFRRMGQASRCSPTADQEEVSTL